MAVAYSVSVICKTAPRSHSSRTSTSCSPRATVWQPLSVSVRSIRPSTPRTPVTTSMGSSEKTRTCTRKIAIRCSRPPWALASTCSTIRLTGAVMPACAPDTSTGWLNSAEASSALTWVGSPWV